VRSVLTKSPRRAAGLLVASAAVLLAAACGGSTSSNSGSGDGNSGNNGGGRNNAAFTAYIDCMAKNGVTIAMPSGGPRPSRSPGEFPSGQPRPSGSAGNRGGGGFPGGGNMFQKPAGVDDATWEKAQAACASVRPSGRGGNGGGANQAYRNCLQQHGVTLGGNLNTTDPTVQKAMETCKVLRPTASATPTA
jgi:hypothetical protein